MSSSGNCERCTQVDAALTGMLAERVGVDPARDLRVRMLVATVPAAAPTANNWWHESDRSRPPMSVLDDADDLVAPTQLRMP